jgi:hemolysin-activating ACP:hemolysin acyltransferase
MTDIDRYHLYLEIVEFLHSCGGPYAVIDPEECCNLIDCLYAGQYYIERDEAGKIVTFCDWWRFRTGELATIKRGGKPRDITIGECLFIVDHASAARDGVAKMRSAIRNSTDLKGVAWFHKRKTPENFRYFPSQEGRKHG